MNEIWEIEVPPTNEQDTEKTFNRREGGFIDAKCLIITGSHFLNTTEIGDLIARALENLGPGEYEIQLVRV